LLWFALAFLAEMSIAINHPPRPPGAVILYSLIGIAFLLLGWTTAAALRRASASARRPWRVDASLLLYLALQAAISAAGWPLLPLIHDESPFAASLLSAALPVVLAAPLAPWLVAIAVERPLAVSPWRFLGRANGWLPPLLVLTLVLLLPVELAEIWVSIAVLALSGDAAAFALVYGVLVALSGMIGLAMGLVAYRSVAEA
jgi:hypothetical protein